MELTSVLMKNYLPYAKGTIVSRAIPYIDGLKPVNRKILYTMYKMGLLNGGKTKSANIVGQTMKLHPHGDGAIYEAMVRMTTGNESLLVPYIESKGNFGKVWSRDIAYAAPRYTEAKLAQICKELFDGIDENAVDFVDNYDSTMKEPVILPVKFPSILVNTSSGIAVGKSSNIPSFGLKEVCDATIGILDGDITDPYSLMEVLGAPEFTTSGYIHGDLKDYYGLGRTGQGTVTVSGAVETYSDRIVIKEIPYRTTIEAILDDVMAAVKDGEIKEIVDIKDESDINGLKGVIYLKRGCNVSSVLKKIIRVSKLRMQMSFITRVILEKDGKTRCIDLGLLELLQEWINFRMETIRRIYEFRLNRKLEQEHLLEAWEKIKDDVKEVAISIASNEEVKVRGYLMSNYNMDEVQANYLLDARGKEFTTNWVAKRLSELASIREDITLFREIVSNDDRKKDIIINELQTIRDKYGIQRKTDMIGPIVNEKEDTLEEEVEDLNVSIIVTKRGYIKRLITLRDESSLVLHEDDEVKWRFGCSNRDSILVFTYSGMCYKIPVHMVDASRGVPKDFISNLIDKVDDSEILCIVPANDYNGSINVVYSSGRGTKVRFENVSGNRTRYKNVFDGGSPGTLWYTTEDKFFMITQQRKAAYIDLEIVSKMSTRSAFKVARVGNDDHIFGIQPLSKVPNPNEIDLERYSKGYCVKIKDTLWSKK